MNWAERQFEWLKSIISETYNESTGIAGKGSSRRMMEMAVVWTFIFAYVKVCIATVTFIALDWTWAVMLCGILGLKSLDIIAQKKGLNGNGTNNGTSNGTSNGDPH